MFLLSAENVKGKHRERNTNTNIQEQLFLFIKNKFSINEFSVALPRVAFGIFAFMPFVRVLFCSIQKFVDFYLKEKIKSHRDCLILCFTSVNGQFNYRNCFALISLQKNEQKTKHTPTTLIIFLVSS